MSLVRLHPTRQPRAVLNLKQQLDAFMFHEKNDFSAHLNKFVAICDELACHGEEIDQKDRSFLTCSLISVLLFRISRGHVGNRYKV